MQRKPQKKQTKPFSLFKNKKQQKTLDLSKQDQFLFNKTPILASTLQKLKKQSNTPNKKYHHHDNQIQQHSQPEDLQLLSTPTKKLKKAIQNTQTTNFTYTPLQKDLYNFYTINKISLKSLQNIPQPKLEIDTLILTAICDRGIAGKYLVSNLFRNKKGYIDYKSISQRHHDQDDYHAIDAYQSPGDFVIAKVVKSINQNHLQLSLSEFIQLNTKYFRIGQTLPAEIKSIQQMGCHLLVSKCNTYKFFLPTTDYSQQSLSSLTQNKQIITTIIDIDHTNHLIKLQLATLNPLQLNLHNIPQQQLNKLELEQYITPGTLLHTKIIKILKNGVMVKFLKIFIGFIHADHLDEHLEYYAQDQKLTARIIYACVHPPFVYLSQKHVDIHRYTPERTLYTSIPKPEHLTQIQGSFFNKQLQFYIHPTQLNSQHPTTPTKFWIKQNNYFQKYQIMSTKKLGLLVGTTAKQIPFNNFKIYGQIQQGNIFKVMYLDIWNKIIKITYDPFFIQNNNMLLNIDDINYQKQYCGIIKNINENGIVVQFCNNIKGTIPKNQIKMQQLSINQSWIGKSIQIYISHIKQKNKFITLSLLPPTMRPTKLSHHKNISLQQHNNKYLKQSQNYYGTICSIDQKSINPIYIKIQQKLAKISIFHGIRPPSIQNLTIITNLTNYFNIGQKIKVFRKGKQYYLYPPQQLTDNTLKFCKILSQKGTTLRLQTNKNQFHSCHICDITDLIIPHPFTQLTIGQLKLGRILNNGMISLRNSIVSNGIPKTMIECKQKYSADQLRGDYRNRILTVGSAGLQQNTVLFGYIKIFSEKGCFVSLSNDFQVRIQMCQLSDQYIPDKIKYYPINKLILCRLINQKIKTNQPNKHLFDASARQSVIKMGYTIDEDTLMIGLTVTGEVIGYTKGKALIKIDGSKYTGIMSPNDIQLINHNQPIQKSMKLGTHYTMKIIQLSLQGRKLIRLSTLQKYFTKFKGIQLSIEVDPNIINLWDNYQQMLKISSNNQQHCIDIQYQDDYDGEEDQYERIRKLVSCEFGDQGQEKMEGEEAGNQISQNYNEQDKQLGDGDDESAEQQQQSAQQQQKQSQNQHIQDQLSQPKNKPHQTFDSNISKQQLNKRLAQFRQMTNPPQIYQSLILANDSSQSHLQYISSMLTNPNITPTQIRQQFQKSLRTLQTFKDKQNIWIAWLNMELILGNFMQLVKKAIDADAGLNVYQRIIEILREQEHWDVAFQMARKMLKKYNEEPKAYIVMLRHMVREEIQTAKQRITLKQLLRRASQVLKSKDLILIQSHYSKILYEEQKPQEARTIFSNILAKNPKRTDLWSMYIDLQLKYGTLERTRQILEKCLTIKLKRKSIISILKKYYEIQEKYGTEETANIILKRAEQIAKEYQNQQQEENDKDQQMG